MIETLPLPIAGLVRRARNAKSPKERHDTAYWSWEASVRLAVAVNPPADPTPLLRGSLGHWVQATRLPDRELASAALFECIRLFRDRAPTPDPGHRGPFTPRDVVEPLPSYRNSVIGHGALRDPVFYGRAADLLLEGIEAAWRADVFFPTSGQLVYIESIEVDRSGTRRARLLELTGHAGRILAPDQTPEVPDGALPGRLYLCTGSNFVDLHPWLLFESQTIHESILFFNGFRRSPQFLDFLSGRALKGRALSAAFPQVIDDVRSIFAVPAEPRAERNEGTQVEGPVAGFEIHRKLGEGGMGVVYLAEQLSLGRQVALKMLPPDRVSDRVARARFQREVGALARCDHANVVKILEAGETATSVFFAMELVAGINLAAFARLLSQKGEFESTLRNAADRESSTEAHASAASSVESLPSPISPKPPKLDDVRRFCRLFRDAARGVDHLHENGVLHRDLKPSNLMVTFGDGRCVVMDLGLAKIDDALTITADRTKVMGTLRYLAPEQLQRRLVQVDHRADVYSLGATFYELLVGAPIFDGDSEARLIEQILRERPLHPRAANRHVSPDLANVLLKATEKDPRLRYDTAAALAADLDALLNGRPVSARPPTMRYLLGLAIRRNKPLSITILTAGLALLILAGFYINGQRKLAETERHEKQSLARRLDGENSRSLIADRQPLPALADASLPLLHRWIDDAKTMIARLPDYRVRLSSLPRSNVEHAELSRTLARVTDIEKVHLARALAEVAAIDGTREICEEADWAEAIDQIASSDVYPGLERIVRQRGLVPLRADPDSRLWEFWHVSSGKRPQVDPKTNRYVIRGDTGIVLVLVPGGSFTMGSPPDENRRLPDEREHTVTLHPFFVGKYEVTQAQWERAMYENPSFYTPGIVCGKKTITPSNPVEVVNWFQCRQFVRRVGLALPTEAQWEYAARAGKATVFVWGDDPRCLAGKENQRDQAMKASHVEPPFNPWDDGHQVHAPVGSFTPNDWGLFDVSGNVAEWTGDYYVEVYPGDSEEPGDGRLDAESERYATFRGASWYLVCLHARLALRHRDRPQAANSSRGLRVARRLAR